MTNLLVSSWEIFTNISSDSCQTISLSLRSGSTCSGFESHAQPAADGSGPASNSGRGSEAEEAALPAGLADRCVWGAVINFEALGAAGTEEDPEVQGGGTEHRQVCCQACTAFLDVLVVYTSVAQASGTVASMYQWSRL